MSSGTNGFQTSYANERPSSAMGSGDAEVASDPATSGFFSNDYKNDPASSGIFSNDVKKHEDLKTMLDGNKDNLKLEAMKRIIGMVAKGKDASDLFPAVVKNVVSKNIEVKKLVYVYLTRYAEEQQDLALLSISTFQRALKQGDPNQLIRASALRVLSSIRVPMIVPIMMLAIKEAVMDMSPYVRKTAAHAIPKLFSLDPEQKDILIEVIEKLLADKTTLVAGSAIQAFEEVCPERIDLIHKNYRKLCNLLVDVEEWGQVVIINMLSRYCRTQFLNPNQHEMAEENDQNFYESSEEEQEPVEQSEVPKKKPYVMDPDHRLLLRTCKPLLNSRNAAVVMAVAQLYHHCAPKTEVGLVAKALVRLLRGHKEVQFVVLGNIATMTIKRKGIFEPYLKSFYVRPNDPTHVKLLKLEILTNLATETSISTILREFQTYVSSSDKEFAAATIHAIGRCASSINEITDACLNGLVSLMSNRDECVVGESVVVIKKLLQMEMREGQKRKPTQHKEIIIHMAKLVDKITVPMARASILWLIGEYSDRVPKIAPDVLRKMAKSFIEEEDIVKLQVLNLAAKLCITNSKQTKLLCQYAFNLAKYDQNYDIRDRARFLRQLILPGEKASVFAKHAKKIFLATKPAPVLQSKYKDRDHYQLGTLSHLINMRTTGYQELPDWPLEVPDPGVRNVDVPMPWTETKFTKKKDKKKSFYSDSESSAADDSDEDNSSSDDSSDDSSSSGAMASSSEESMSQTEDDELPKKSRVKASDVKIIKKAISVEKAQSSDNLSTDSSEDDDSDSEESSSEEESSEEEKKVPVRKKPTKKTTASKAPANSKPSAMLLDLDDFGPVSAPMATVDSNNSQVLMPMLASDLKNLSLKPNNDTATSSIINSPTVVPGKSFDLLNRITGNGLGATYKFTRSVSIYSAKMLSVEVTFTNHSDAVINAIRIGDKKLQSGMQLHEFQQIGALAVNASTSVIMGVDFCDTTQPAVFDLCTEGRKYSVKIVAPVGELVQPTTLIENDFNALQVKLRGMNENTGTIEVPAESRNGQSICERVLETANVLQVPSIGEDTFKFAAKTLSSKLDLLVSVKLKDSKASITVNCEKMVIGSMLVKDIKSALQR